MLGPLIIQYPVPRTPPMANARNAANLMKEFSLLDLLEAKND
jgi:hypothetical protein